MTRKNTPKYEVCHMASGTIVLTGVSKTSANETKRMMGHKGLLVRPVKQN